MQQTSAPAHEEQNFSPAGTSFMLKLLYAFLGMVVLSIIINLGGKWLGDRLVLAGHSEKTDIHEIVIGNSVIAVPENMIRFDRDRRDGAADRIDLYMRWPALDGYSATAKDDFNHANGKKAIIFISMEEPVMSRDMSGRFMPIYRSLIDRPSAGPGGLTFYQFREKSGYLNEVLAVSGNGEAPYVARCLSGTSAEESLAPCERDIRINDALSLSYRFPREFLGDWQRLDAAIREKAERMISTAP